MLSLSTQLIYSTSSLFIASSISHQHLRWLITVIVLLLLIIQLASVHSMGTLLHAGPSCIIKPQQQQQSNFIVFDSPVKHRGICYSTLLCKQKGGVAIGKCGLGNSCCVFPQTCNSISVRNSTYFTSPEYPSLMNRSMEFEKFEEENIHVKNDNRNNNDNNRNQCSLTIHRMPGIHPICRIRLDFIEYEIEGHQTDTAMIYTENDSNSNGCNNFDNGVLDWITIKAMHDDQTNIIEPICPTSKVGQHVIVDVRKHIGPFLLTVHTGSWSGRRRWNILINQIECNRNGASFRSKEQILSNSIDT